MTDTSDTGGAPRRPRSAAVRWLETAELVAGVALLAVMFSLMLIQALQRHLHVAGWVWTGELARLGLVWLTFSLAGYLLGRDDHITLKLIDFAPQVWLRRGAWVLANLVVAAVCAAFVVEAAELVFGGSPQSTPAIGIPMTWVYVIPLAGLALTAARAAVNAFQAGPANPEGRIAADADAGETGR